MRAFRFSFISKLTVLAMLSVFPPDGAVAQVEGNGDYDGDYDVDQDDFFNWAGCMGGEGVYVDPWSSCAAFDFDADRVSWANSCGGRELWPVAVAGTRENLEKLAPRP